FTLKVDQLTGNQWLWINPNFFAFEDIGSADTTVGAAFSSSGGQPVLGSALDRIVFRGGDFAAPSTTVSYTNFSVYFGGSSPFIPEPSTALLAGLGSLLLLRRKRS
ncbi:MAG: PEP-CTERM sorting domain-containing protein, partial [Akkermansiaceae bacterium]